MRAWLVTRLRPARAARKQTKASYNNMFAVQDNSLNAVASGSTANTKRCCWPSHAAVPQRWVDIVISAQIADILPSLTTRVATGIVPDARATPASAGFRRGDKS